MNSAHFNTSAFNEFVRLINANYQLDDEILATMEQMYEAMYQDIEKFKTLLVDKLDFDPDEAEFMTAKPDIDELFGDLPRDPDELRAYLINELEYDDEDADKFVSSVMSATNGGQEMVDNRHTFLIHEMFSYFFPCYGDDWKIDCEGLSSYISQYTDIPFVFNDKEYLPLNEIDELLNKLKSQTPYSLVHIWSGSDDVHFYLINQKDEDRIIELAKVLDIWLS